MSQQSAKKIDEKQVKTLPISNTGESVKATETVKIVTQPLKDVTKQEEEIKRLLSPSVEQRLKSMEQMRILGEKFTFLKDKKDNLEKFILSSDGTKEKITLSNARGFLFEVSNSQTIEKVLEVIQKDLDLFTSRAEKEILEFNV